MSLARRLLILVALLCGGFAANSAHAQLLCTATSAGMSFGSYSPVGAAPSASATIGIKCTGLLAKARMCLSIGPGVGQTSYSPRYMSSGTGTLAYNLYSDSAGTSVIGSTLAPAGFPMAAFDLPVSAGKVDTSITIYGKVMPSQPSVVAGAYSASFGSTAAVGIQTLPATGTFLDCLAIGALTGTFNFPVTATVVNDCTITAANIDFGSRGLLQSTLTATGGITVACTNATAYTVALSPGNGSGATAAARYMTRSGGSDKVSYGLYTTTSYSVPWGDGTSGSSTVSGTGTGASQTIPVYARVLPQSTPTPGSYSDTIIATVTF